MFLFLFDLNYMLPSQEAIAGLLRHHVKSSRIMELFEGIEDTTQYLKIKSKI